jgi:hypothetical protein
MSLSTVPTTVPDPVMAFALAYQLAVAASIALTLGGPFYGAAPVSQQQQALAA